MNRAKREKLYQRRLAKYRESSLAEIMSGLKRHQPGSRNRKKIGR